jgi:acetyl-CoA synthetase
MLFNLAQMICSKHEDAIFRIALDELRSAGTNTYTFGGLDYLSDKFATVLQNCGINPGDVVAITLPPSAAFIVAHFAALKLGAVIAPCNAALQIDMFNQLIIECQAKALVIDEAQFNNSEKLIADSDDMQIFIASDYVSNSDFGKQRKGFWYEINFAGASFKLATTDDTTPAYVFFEPKDKNISRVIFTHGFLAEHLRKIEKSSGVSFKEAESRQTATDWSSKNLLFDFLYPALFAGASIESSASKSQKDKGLP